MEAVSFDEFYKAYGESLASRLKAVGHRSERPAFIFVEDMGDPLEVLAFINTAKNRPEPSGFVLVWENYVEDFDTGGRDNYHTSLKGSVALIRKVAAKDGKEAAIRTTHSEARKGVLTALSLMLEESQDGQLADRDIVVELRQMPGEKIKALSGDWYGYILQFTWLAGLDLSLDEAELLA